MAFTKAIDESDLYSLHWGKGYISGLSDGRALSSAAILQGNLRILHDSFTFDSLEVGAISVGPQFVDDGTIVDCRGNSPSHPTSGGILSVVLMSSPDQFTGVEIKTLFSFEYTVRDWAAMYWNNIISFNVSAGNCIGLKNDGLAPMSAGIFNLSCIYT